MVNRVLDHLEEWLITFLIGAATLIIFAAVVHRYLTGWATGGFQDALLKIDMSWAQELTIFMFVWMAKFGAAYGVRTGIHVGVDVLINALNDRTRGWFIIFGLLAGALFTGIIGTFGAHFVWELMHTEQVSADLELPKWIVYACIPLGSYLMCYRFLQVAWKFHKTGHLPHADHGHVEGLDKEDATQWIKVEDSDLHPRDVKPGSQP
ncbi:MAG: TRAP transporter small permease [Betaproteobacteria bacterium]